MGWEHITGKAEEATVLAMTVLFGSRFADEVDPDLLIALEQTPERVGELLLESWRTRGADLQQLAPGSPEAINPRFS